MASDESHSNSETAVKTTIRTHLPLDCGTLKPSPTDQKPTLKTTTRTTPNTMTLRPFLLIILPLLSIFGLYATLILALNNNLLSILGSLLSAPDLFLPGTNAVLVKRYTGLKWLDNHLSILVMFFGPVMDPGYGREGAWLYVVFGVGQLGGAWVVMVMEGLRVGNKGLLVSFVGTTGLILQNMSFAFTIPLWLLLHLLTSPVAKSSPGTNANSVLLIPTWDLRVLPFSIAISYILPTLLMGFPCRPSTHQFWIAFWQPFPVWTVMTHYLLRTAAERISEYVWKTDPKTRTPVSQATSYLNHAKYVYQFIIGLCMATHLPVLLIGILPSWIFPSFSPFLARLGKETIGSIFIPPFPSFQHKVSSLGEGVHLLLQWDVYTGCTALLLWAVLLYQNATTEETVVDPTSSLPVYRELLTGETAKKYSGEKATRKLVLKVVGWGLACGPVGVLVMLLWQRDTVVRQKIKQGV